MTMPHKVLVILEISLFMGNMGTILMTLLAAPLENTLQNHKKTFLRKEVCSLTERRQQSTTTAALVRRLI